MGAAGRAGLDSAGGMLLFHAAASSRLSKRAAAIFEAAERRTAMVYVPVAVLWECGLLALARRIPFSSNTLELRAEAFNVLSTTNYDEYVGALSSPFYGQPVSAFPKRRLQFAAVVRF